GLRALQELKDARELRAATARRQPWPRPSVEAAHTDALAFGEHQVRDRGRETAGVVHLSVAARRRRRARARVGHRAAAIEQQDAAEIRFLVELAHERTVGAGEQAPVESPRLVAGDVAEVVPELDAGAAVR